MISITPTNFDPVYAEDILEKKLDEHNAYRKITGLKAKFVPAKDLLLKRTGAMQFIPQEEWTNITPFISPSMMNLCHPHHRILWHRFLENFKPRSDVLLVANCSATKPYIKNRQYRHYVKLANLCWFDFCIMSFHPVMCIPFDSSSMYPNIMYDWPHNESQEMARQKVAHNTTLWVEFLSRFKYKKIIFCLNENPSHNAVYYKLKETFPDIEMSLLWEDWEPFRHFATKIYRGRGLWKSRVHEFIQTREFISHQLGNSDQFRRDSKLNK